MPGSGAFIERLLADAALVIGAETSAAQAYVQKKLPVEVAAFPWYADAKGEAWQALEMKGTPVIIGIRKGRMEWVISGLLKDSATLTSAIRTRVDY
jgi:hypothetical protein